MFVRDTSSRKLTYLRLSVTKRCNMRCSYCMPHGSEAGVSHLKELSTDEISRLTHALAQNGITKVRITGGEPLIREDILNVIEAVAKTPGINTIGLTTNGLLLPDLAKRLVEMGVNCINISLDSLEPASYRRITGIDELECAIEGLHAAIGCGLRVKTNTVVMRGFNDNEIPAIANLARELPIDVRFIELMPLGHITPEWQSLYVSAEEILNAIGNFGIIQSITNESAQMYEIPDGIGRIGIISPVSKSFCARCSRIRITSQGLLMPCLRSNTAIDIRPLLADPNIICEFGDVLTQCWKHKLTGNSNNHEPVYVSAMSAIGG